MVLNNKNWLDDISTYARDNGMSDIWYILYVAIIKKNKYNLNQVLDMAVNGQGIYPSEGLGYMLDHDYDFNEEFKSVDSYVGGIASSQVEVKDFINFMAVVCRSYLSIYPDDKDEVENSLSKIRLRYKKFLA